MFVTRALIIVTGGGSPLSARSQVCGPVSDIGFWKIKPVHRSLEPPRRDPVHFDTQRREKGSGRGVWSRRECATSQAGEELALISPSTQFVGEVYVAPKDVGLIRRGGSVRVLVDAFNYTQWGVITGTLTALSGDIRVLDGAPVLLLRWSLDRSQPALRIGVRGALRMDIRDVAQHGSVGGALQIRALLIAAIIPTLSHCPTCYAADPGRGVHKTTLFITQ